MAKNCGHNVPCGCGDKALTTPPPCNVSGPCEGEACAELFDEQCIVHTGPTYQITNSDGFVFTVEKGDRLDTILQGILVQLISTASVPEAATGVRITDITSTGFTIKWKGLDTTTYTIDAEQQSPIVNNPITVGLGVYTYTYINLISGETYNITITDGATQSVTFIITLP
jgi:hypothetical protein